MILIISLVSTQEIATAMIDVVATKDGKQPLGNTPIIFKTSEGKTFHGHTDKNGLFQIELPKSVQMHIFVQSVTGLYPVGEINIPSHVPGGKWHVEFNDNQMELADVFFDSGKYKLLEGSFHALNQMAEGMKQNLHYRFEIAGHTDDIGSAQANMSLSLKRAQSVVNYLKSQGINGSRLRAKGYGSTQPKVSNSSESGREKNRRIEARTLPLN